MPANKGSFDHLTSGVGTARTEPTKPLPIVDKNAQPVIYSTSLETAFEVHASEDGTEWTLLYQTNSFDDAVGVANLILKITTKYTHTHVLNAGAPKGTAPSFAPRLSRV